MNEAAALTRRMAATGADMTAIGAAVAGLADAAAIRHLQQAEAEWGPPPAPYVWLAAGSQGRREQAALSDQDNALIYADSVADDPAAADWFARLAARVCDRLNADGYVYCPGEMMARNPRWRQPLRVWRGYFASWINDPEPLALMLASVLFDMRPVWGDAGLFAALQPEILAQARDNRIFLAHFAANALSRRPPLGFWGGLRPLSDGPHAGAIDLKHDGLIPVVDMARLYALAGGVAAANTLERLDGAAKAGAVSRRGGDSLMTAWRDIAALRQDAQLRQAERGEAVDNFIRPADLSTADRDRLRRALTAIRDMQAAVSLAFPLSQF